MNFNFSCIGSRILLDVPHQIWEAQSYNGTTQVSLVRFFHNKVSFILSDYLRCYLSYFSPDFIVGTFTILGLVLFLIGLYHLIKGRKKFFLALLLLAPLFPLFEFPAIVVIRGGIIYAALLSVMVYGVVSWLRKK